MSAKLAIATPDTGTTCSTEGDLSQFALPERGATTPDSPRIAATSKEATSTSKSTDVATIILKIVREERPRHNS